MLSCRLWWTRENQCYLQKLRTSWVGNIMKYRIWSWSTRINNTQLWKLNFSVHRMCFVSIFHQTRIIWCVNVLIKRFSCGRWRQVKDIGEIVSQRRKIASNLLIMKNLTAILANLIMKQKHFPWRFHFIDLLRFIQMENIYFLETYPQFIPLMGNRKSFSARVIVDFLCVHY